MPTGIGFNNAGFGDADLGDAIGNAFTGNLDFHRQEYLFNRQVAANNAAARDDRAFTAQQNELNRAFNAAEAEKARAFSKEQSETQYLRAADQLKKLGINPAVLAFGGSAGSAQALGGSSASAPSGSAGSHHVSGSSWQGTKQNAIGDVLRLASTLLNVASFAFL